MSSEPNPFDFHRGCMPQGRKSFPRAYREAYSIGLDPRSELSWGPVPVQENLLVALHPAPSKWAWEAFLAFVAELLIAGPFDHLHYVYHKSRWHLVVVEMTDQLNVESHAFGRVSLATDGKVHLLYEGIS